MMATKMGEFLKYLYISDSVKNIWIKNTRGNLKYKKLLMLKFFCCIVL